MGTIHNKLVLLKEWIKNHMRIICKILMQIAVNEKLVIAFFLPISPIYFNSIYQFLPWNANIPPSHRTMWRTGIYTQIAFMGLN